MTVILRTAVGMNINPDLITRLISFWKRSQHAAEPGTAIGPQDQLLKFQINFSVNTYINKEKCFTSFCLVIKNTSKIKLSSAINQNTFCLYFNYVHLIRDLLRFLCFNPLRFKRNSIGGFLGYVMRQFLTNFTTDISKIQGLKLYYILSK